MKRDRFSYVKHVTCVPVQPIDSVYRMYIILLIIYSRHDPSSIVLNATQLNSLKEYWYMHISASIIKQPVRLICMSLAPHANWMLKHRFRSHPLPSFHGCVVLVAPNLHLADRCKAFKWRDPDGLFCSLTLSRNAYFDRVSLLFDCM